MWENDFKEMIAAFLFSREINLIWKCKLPNAQNYMLFHAIFIKTIPFDSIRIYLLNTMR
jgi:hypothetical protein